MSRLRTEALIAVSAAALAGALGIGNAGAGEIAEGQATPDSVFETTIRRPLAYYTTYDRDRSNGTWTQNLNFGISRGRVAFTTTGSVSTLDDVTRPDYGGSNGHIGGRLDLRPVPRWVVSVDGRFDKVASGSEASSSRQRRNRLLLQTQYTANPWRTLTTRAILTSEFQQDQNLSFRPLPGVQKVVGVDTFYVHDQRDSSFMSARQDGATGSLRWEPATWMTLDGVVTGSRIRPTTKSFLYDFVKASDGSAAIPQLQDTTIVSTNTNLRYQSTVDVRPAPKTKAKIEFVSQNLEQSYFERQLRGQEHRTFDQRSGTLHLEQIAAWGISFLLDGTLSRTLGEFALRRTNASLVNRRSLAGTANYYGPGGKRASVSLQLDRSRNERQISQNGLMLTRFLTVNGAHPVSKRFALDASGSVSLFSYRYEEPVSDRDNTRTSGSVGGRYELSPLCATGVHFSVNRGHSIAIDPSASGNNAVETTYQMDATLSLRTGSHLTVTQNYVLNATYRIYDSDSLESRNTLNRIRRIDTTISDQLFSFAEVRLTHNFLFRDSGTFIRDPVDGVREYGASVETYQQNLGVTFGIRPIANALLSVTESLANTRDRFLASGTERVTNRWSLTAGGEIDRPLSGGASIRGAVRHVGAYTERVLPSDPLFEENFWIAGVSFQKRFE